MGVLAGRLGWPLWGHGSSDPRLTPYLMALTASGFMTNDLTSTGPGATTRLRSKADLTPTFDGSLLSTLGP